MTAGMKSRMESKYSPEKEREQDPDYKHSAFTSIDSIADYTKNRECLKFQLFCLFSNALWTLIFTFAYWEVLCICSPGQNNISILTAMEDTYPTSLLKEGSSRASFAANAQCCVTATVVQTGPPGPLLQAACSQPHVCTWCYDSTGGGGEISLRCTSLSFFGSISPVCVKDDLDGRSSISCSNYFPQFHVVSELI